MSVFVDTGPWYAIIVPVDPRHAQTLDWLRQNSDPLVTTDYIIDETLTLLRARGEKSRAIALGRRVLDLADVTVHMITKPEFREAWKLFRDNPARDWSFTDCTSKIVMHRLHIKRALSFDAHFEQFDGVEVVP